MRLCGILARRSPAGCFMGGPKLRKQPERHAAFFEIDFLSFWSYI
jgi:hypothetical protein